MHLDLLQLREQGGLLLVDKPRTWTSFDVVNKLRYALKIKKVGHAGTLDPLATGLLLIGVGKGTKMLNELQGFDKTYTGIFEFGKTTPSYDLESEFDSIVDASNLTEDDIENAVNAQRGTIEQIPPKFSAIKVNGTRAYKLARQNEEVEIKTRQITIQKFEYDFQKPELHFEIECSKGTYIRSIAHDLGQHTGVGAYLKSLRRTKVGTYGIENAWSLDELISQIAEHAGH